MIVVVTVEDGVGGGGVCGERPKIVLLTRRKMVVSVWGLCLFAC
jgi:hypothetical protein